MEVKIGVQFASRELVLESGQTSDEVQQAVTGAIESGAGTLTLVDENDRRIIVPVDKIAYVEIAEATSRQVGFTAG